MHEMLILEADKINKFIPSDPLNCSLYKQTLNHLAIRETYIFFLILNAFKNEIFINKYCSVGLSFELSVS